MSYDIYFVKNTVSSFDQGLEWLEEEQQNHREFQISQLTLNDLEKKLSEVSPNTFEGKSNGELNWNICQVGIDEGSITLTIPYWQSSIKEAGLLEIKEIVATLLKASLVGVDPQTEDLVKDADKFIEHLRAHISDVLCAPPFQ